MNKKLLLLSCLMFLAAKLWAAQFTTGTLPLVDGIYNSTQTIVTAHQPVFSWEYSGTVSSFTVTVSSDNVFSPSGELWSYTCSTTAANTINYITRVSYDADGTALQALAAGATYYWQVVIYGDDGSSAAASGRFSTIDAAVTLDGDKFDLAVDWNNPFNPAKGQYTVFRYAAKDRDRNLQIRIFSLSGEFIREWPEQAAMQGAWYTVNWDGKNADGVIVARGIYFVNLIDLGDKKGITRRVAVVK